MSLHPMLKQVPKNIALPEATKVKPTSEKEYTFNRNYFLIKTENNTFVTKELVTMVQLLPVLKVSGLETDRTLFVLSRTDGPKVLSDVKDNEYLIENKKNQAEAARKKKKAAAEKKVKELVKKQNPEVADIFPVEESQAPEETTNTDEEGKA